MLADRKARPQPMMLAIPPHKAAHSSESGPSKSNSGREASAPASPQPQPSSGYHHHTPQHSSQQPPQQYHHQIPQPHQSQRPQPQPHQTQKTASGAAPTHPRRGSTDRGAKDSTRTRSSTPKTAPEHVGPYLLGKTLGKGSSGCVKLARHRKTNEQVAVKIISKASLANRAAVHRGIEREIAIMKLINHPHVIRLYDVYETEKELFLVMEYVSGGELFEYLVNKGRLDEAEALRFFQQIIVGLAFCHKRNICHRDLKPENLLLDDRMNVKIADFGMASLQKTGRLLETSCGSPHYASPEVVTGLKYDGSSSDIWSCGIILYALLTGHLPFDDENIRQLLSKVKAGKFYMPTDISPGARDLISRMLTVNPKRRITMQGVMMHPWFRMVNPERNTLGEPAEDPESGRPLPAEELDAEILRHMRWLFAPGPSHSDPEAKEVFDEEALLQEIEEKMINSEENMEKLFYHLLCQHKMELLENYSADDNDSVLDGPRRRADSFPNSAASARSHTPDFSRSTRSSPLASPGPPMSPMTKMSHNEPSPLTLNPLESAVARAVSASKMASRTPSPAIQSKINLQDVPVSETIIPKEQRPASARSSRRGSEDATVATEDTGKTSIEMTKQDSGRGSAVPKEEKLAPVVESILETVITDLDAALESAPVSTHPEVISPKPVSPIAQRSPMVNRGVPRPISVHLETKEQEETKPTDSSATPECNNTDSDSSLSPSIESQVLSTQISDISCAAMSTQSAAVVDSEPSTRTISPMLASDGASMQSAPSTKPQRPILHPLDVKASAGTTPMSVSVSQHSRKYSDGSPSVHSATPLSPNGPKRPWFARLFDFKPQPLTFRSNWPAAETQDRLEAILRDLFGAGITIESLKRPNYGVKCRYEGGVMNEQVAKAVKFKIEISEKSGYLISSASSVSTAGSINSQIVSSSAVAAILATVDVQQGSGSARHYHQYHGNQSQTHLPAGFLPGNVSPEPVGARRASDGGSILSSAAAAVSTGLAAARIPFQNSHHGSNNSNSNHSQSGNSNSSGSTSGITHGQTPAHVHHHQSHHLHHNHPSNSGSSSGYPPLPHLLTLPRRTAKVTLHQQQGANSTLKMIYEKLQVAWEQQQQHFQLASDSEFSLIASPPPTMHKAQRGAAM
ncbi:eukaryotic-like serine/threonine-protein kinase [Entomortierella parvispora]|uniref:non-specific serine/threonine protein kinase n=1 Tax=Entomortierella parvispora TaxID=205924 RepID=A0A9P3HGX3_9FUNG|nr:eukaryotic-like serine/threonine-protein kinase [Entomortierella parvispora]